MEATTATAVVGDLDSPRDVLVAARAETRTAEAAEARRLQLAVTWADQHPAESLEAAEVFRAPGYWGGADDSAVPIAGPGAPLVAEFSVAEFAAAVGMSTDAGKRYLGQAVELRYRLPRLWRRVVAGDLAGWKARRVAQETISRALAPDAAAYVDRHLAPVAHKIGVAATDRLIEEAIARYMPQTAEATRRQAADGRHFEIDHHQITFAGTSLIHGEVDLADALDLDQVVTHGAAALKDLGCEESLDVRRAMAVGDLARRQLALDLSTTDPTADTAPSTVRPVRPKRRVVLYVHLHQSALDGAGSPVGRVENTRSPVTAEQIRTWCGHPDAKVTVKPVLDLADHVSVDAYEVPDRIAEAVALREITCVFPWCTRPARKLPSDRPDRHGCDCDHVTPHGRAGPTCTCNLAPLCRRHHRLKTHGRWTYTTLEPGSYLWRSPHGYQYLRDHTGTIDVSRDRHTPSPRPDE